MAERVAEDIRLDPSKYREESLVQQDTERDDALAMQIRAAWGLPTDLTNYGFEVLWCLCVCVCVYVCMCVGAADRPH